MYVYMHAKMSNQRCQSILLLVTDNDQKFVYLLGK